jgi:hypothetical protein
LNAQQALADLWQLAGLPEEALGCAQLTGADPVYPSSFRVATAAQSTIAAAALAACELAHVRGTPRQTVQVDAVHAAAECSAWFSIDGRTPDIWDKFSGLYRTSDGWVRVHANFRHHRDGALRLLGLDPVQAERKDAEAAMLAWKALDYEDASAREGLVAFALSSFAQWDASPQGQAIAAQPLLTITRIGDAPPRALPILSAQDLPLHGVRVLDLTRILAGPVGGRALAAYGADVMLVNAPHLPNIEAIADTSRGKRSVLLDLRDADDRERMDALVQGAHVLVQGYRPGALEKLGHGPEDVAQRSPGIVYVSLSAFGAHGPWRERRGFDSLVQTATGFNLAEAEAAGDASRPRALPMQILDEATGFLIAFGAAAALRRQQREGGSWHVQLSLAQTGQWLRGLGRVRDGFAVQPPALEPFLETTPTAWGLLRGVRHSAQRGRAAVGPRRPSERPGDSPPRW